MVTLVLCIDRDDDFGRKAAVQSPIVGRRANVEAAEALILKDPEEADANAVFGAVNLYDELVGKGEAAEVVTICGHPLVGPTSDRIITEQLDRVLGDIKPDRALFVTDGVEDEFILPLVTSRVRVDAIRRIIVKQHADIEGTYYIIKKALEDEKMQRTLVVPFALSLLVYGLAAVTGYTDQGVGAIAITVGAYFLAKALHMGASVRQLAKDLYEGLASGSVALFTSLLSLLLVVFGAVRAVNEVLDFGSATILQYSLVAADTILWWVVGAALVSVAGRVIDTYIREDLVLWNYWILPFSLVAVGLIADATIRIVNNVLTDAFPVRFEDLRDLGLGVAVAVIGAATNAYVRHAFIHGELHPHEGAEDAEAPAPVPGR